MPFNENLTEAVWRRTAYLELLQDRPRTKQELVEQIGCSQQNVYKRTGELRELGLVELNENKYHLTLYGQLALHRYRELERTKDYADILTTETIEDELPPAVLEDAEFVPTRSAMAEEPLSLIDRELRNHDQVEGFSCTLFTPNRVNTYYDQVVEEDLELKAVANHKLFDYIASEHGGEALSAFRSGQFTLWVTDKTMPFSTMIFDRSKIAVSVLETEAEIKEITSLKGVILNDTEEAVDWALAKYRDYKKHAERVTSNDVSRKETGV